MRPSDKYIQTPRTRFYDIQSELEKEIRDRSINMRVAFRRQQEKILKRYLELNNLYFIYDEIKRGYSVKDVLGNTVELPEHLFLRDNFAEIAIEEIEKHLRG